MQGLGFELLAQVLESTAPSHVLQLDTNNANSNLPPHLWWLPEDGQHHHRPAVYHLPSVGALQQGTSNTLPGLLRHTAAMTFPVMVVPPCHIVNFCTQESVVHVTSSAACWDCAQGAL